MLNQPNPVPMTSEAILLELVDGLLEARTLDHVNIVGGKAGNASERNSYGRDPVSSPG